MARGLAPNRGGADGELAEARAAGLHRTHIALLAQSRHRAVREAIAKRDDLPLGVQASLADDDWHEVRATVAANPHIAGSILDALTDDRHHLVLIALLSNPSLRTEAMRKLEGHKRADVRSAAHARAERHVAESGKDDSHAMHEDDATPELRERAVVLSDVDLFERDAPPAFMLATAMARRAGEEPSAAPRTAPVVGRPEPSHATFDPEPGTEPLSTFDADRGPELRRDPSVEYLVVSLPPDEPATSPSRPVSALAGRMPSPPPLAAAAAPSASRVFRVSATI